MQVSDILRKALDQLGLTNYETRAYIALIESGGATAAEISRQSGLPYSKVYEVLASLEEKGWIEAEAGRSRPVRFYPKAPSTALDTMQMKLESDWNRSREIILSELTPVYEKREAKEKPEIWIVRGEFNLLTKVKETLNSCRDELMIAVPPQIAGVIDSLQPIFEELKKKGVKINLMAIENGDK